MQCHLPSQQPDSTHINQHIGSARGRPDPPRGAGNASSLCLDSGGCEGELHGKANLADIVIDKITLLMTPLFSPYFCCFTKGFTA